MAAADDSPRGTEQRLRDAGIAGSVDLSNQLGLSFNTLGQLGRIYLKQLDWFFRDQRASMEMLGQTMNPLSTWVDHLGRRSQHVSEGFRELFETVQDTRERSSDLRHTAWDPYARASNVPPARFEAAREGVMERLHADHRHLAQVLAKLEELLDKPDPMEPQDKDLLLQGIRYIAEYPDAVHHPLEDRLFKHLLAANLSAAERQDVENNAAGHKQLAAATAEVLEEVTAVRSGAAPASAGLKTDLLKYIELQREHIAFEEKRIFALAEAKLPPAALEAVGDEDERAQDPLFDYRRDRFDGLYDYVAGRL